MVCSRIDSHRRRGRESLTKSAPGSGHGGGADKVGGVVEETEDAGGVVGADPVQEVPAAALRRRHGGTELPFFLKRRERLNLRCWGTRLPCDVQGECDVMETIQPKYHY
jgi:hypothetical protein